MTEKCKMVDDQLEQVSGGAGEEKKYYCVEGYSKAYGGNVKLYVSTYNDAVNVLPQNTFTFPQRQQPQKGASHDKPYTWPAGYQLWRDCYGGRIPREDR